LVLSNRAQSYLKLKAYQKAFDDSNRACKIDPEHVKSIGRRGTANYYLGNIKQAKRDFVRGLKLEEGNKQFYEYLSKTEEKLQKIKQEAYEKMERRVMFTDLNEMGFEEEAVRIHTQELHLDKQLVEEMQQKKEAVIYK